MTQFVLITGQKARIGLFILALGLCLTNCRQNDGEDQLLKSYYYPIQDWNAPKEYVYKSLLQPNAPREIWRYTTELKEGKTFLIAENGDFAGRILQRNREEIVKSGSILKSLELFQYDSLGNQSQIDVQITGNNVFPFAEVDSTVVFFYKVEWFQPQDSLKIILTRNRRFKRFDRYVLNDIEYPTVVFELRELLQTDQEGLTESQWVGEEHYAQGIGLCYYQKKISQDLEIAYELVSW